MTKPIPPTPEVRAIAQCNGMLAFANNLVKQHNAYKADGIPAQGEQPAVPASLYISTLGKDNLAILDAVAAANPQA